MFLSNTSSRQTPSKRAEYYSACRCADGITDYFDSRRGPTSSRVLGGESYRPVEEVRSGSLGWDPLRAWEDGAFAEPFRRLEPDPCGRVFVQPDMNITHLTPPYRYDPPLELSLIVHDARFPASYRFSSLLGLVAIGALYNPWIGFHCVTLVPNDLQGTVGAEAAVPICDLLCEYRLQSGVRELVRAMDKGIMGKPWCECLEIP